MKIWLATEVPGYYTEVFNAFEKDLFEALSPRLVDVEVMEFGGSKPGDRVHIRINTPFGKQDWVSLITDQQIGEEECLFTDEGETLPAPLTFWRHHHRVQRVSDNVSRIIDDIEYKAGNPILTRAAYPFLRAQFAARKPIYKKYFSGQL